MAVDGCMGCYIWYSEEGRQPARRPGPPHCTKCSSPLINGQCTKLPIAVSVLLYNGHFLRDFNVPIKWLYTLLSYTGPEQNSILVSCLNRLKFTVSRGMQCIVVD